MCGTNRSELLAPLPSSGSKMPTHVSRRRLFIMRILAVAAFTAYIYSQIHVLSLHDPEGFKLYYPNEYFVLANFIASTILNIHWLRQLFFRWDCADDLMPLAHGCDRDSSDDMKLGTAPLRRYTTGLSSAQVSYLPFHIFGSIFLTAWSIAWIKGYFILSQILASGNLCAHFYTVFSLLHDKADGVITPINYLTHLVMKTNVGLAVLYLWKNWGVVDQITSPSVAQMLNSGVIFLLMTVGSGPDPTVGLCLIYDLAALLLRQPEDGPWYYTFHWIIIAICMCLMAELHLSQRQGFSWLRGFGGFALYADDYLGDDVERQCKKVGIAIWIEAVVPPYFPYAT